MAGDSSRGKDAWIDRQQADFGRKLLRRVTPASYPLAMQPTVRLNHNLLAVESEHTVHAMVEPPRRRRPSTANEGR